MYKSSLFDKTFFCYKIMLGLTSILNKNIYNMINSQLLEYIKQQTHQGVNREQIIQSLLANGWQQSDINEAFVLFDVPLPGQMPVATNKIWFKIGLTVLLILAVGICLYFVTQKYSSVSDTTVMSNKSNLEVSTTTGNVQEGVKNAIDSKPVSNPVISSLYNCESITGDNEQYTCYYQQAINTGDAVVCSRLKGEFRSMCYIGIAIRKKSLSQCALVDGVGEQTYCRFAVAQVTGDTSVCINTQDNYLQDLCNYYIKHQDQPIIEDIGIIGTAINEKDSSVCNQIKYQVTRDWCYSAAKGQ